MDSQTTSSTPYICLFVRDPRDAMARSHIFGGWSRKSEFFKFIMCWISRSTRFFYKSIMCWISSEWNFHKVNNALNLETDSNFLQVHHVLHLENYTSLFCAESREFYYTTLQSLIMCWISREGELYYYYTTLQSLIMCSFAEYYTFFTIFSFLPYIKSFFVPQRRPLYM